ncbi:MAG: hypothetical protein Q7U10_01370 [Thermodesulfovibrionia bacterium]|nr:hypothetical protein [Thermodesulfovibrionia bacterium]
MKIKKPLLSDQRIITCIIVLSLGLFSFLTYYDILGFYFTGTDTLTLIDTGRINSFDDLLRIFSEPMMNSTGFIDIARFYRPISVLSHSLDYSIWKLNPFGHHLTDLFLHSLVSILVFFIIRYITHGRHFTAWLGALIFTTHPAFIQSVPSIENRQDIIAALFLLISLLLFLNYLSAASHRKSYLFFSLLSYVLALGAKEIAVILLPLIFIYVLINTFSDKETFKSRWLNSFKTCLPYLVLTIVYLVWRTYILNGIGGYVNEPSGIFSASKQMFQIVIVYFQLLLYPVDFFFYKARDILLISSLFVLLLSICCLIGCYQYVKLKKHGFNVIHDRLIVFLFLWMLLPLAIHMLTLNIPYWGMYIPGIPFSAIFSIMLVDSFQYTMKKIKGYCFSTFTLRSLFIDTRVLSFLLMAALLISLLAHSPLVRKYRGWEESGTVSYLVLDKLLRVVDKIPNDSVIEIYNLPKDVPAYEFDILHTVHIIFLLHNHSIKSWLDLNYPDNNFKVFIRSRFKPATYPEDFDLEVKAGKTGNMEMNFNYSKAGENVK